MDGPLGMAEAAETAQKTERRLGQKSSLPVPRLRKAAQKKEEEQQKLILSNSYPIRDPY